MMADDPYPELVEITIPQLQAKLKSGQLTSRRLVEMYIERIKMIDTKTRSVLELNPDTLAIADQMDKERKKGRVRSMLHGIPILIKDNIDTADGVENDRRLARSGRRPDTERGRVCRSEASQSGCHYPWQNESERVGEFSRKPFDQWLVGPRAAERNNPYFLDQNPCGSSSGSGVSVQQTWPLPP